MLRKLNSCYPLQLELVPLGLLVFILFYSLSNFGALPDRIPTHFDLNGVVDGWGNKAEILVYPAIGAVVYLLLTGINLAFAAVKDPRSLINLPEKQRARLTPNSIEELRRVMPRSLLAIKTVVLAMLGYLLYSSIRIALGEGGSLSGSWMFLLAGILVAVIVYMLFRVMRLVYARPPEPGRPG
jgi:uncharacterized membrane protein